VHFDVISNPEFLAAGTAINDLLAADRILIGSRPTASGRRAADTLASVYGSWIPRSRIITTNVFSSELAKLVANSMLAQRLSSINSVAAICEATGADVDEISAAIGADPRIGSRFLRAGIGFGGSCFKKDVLSLAYLAETLNLPDVAAYWRCVVTMNGHVRDRFAARVVRCLNNTLRGKKLALLGYAFKDNTNDTRESAALEIIRTLLEEDPREIAVFDPCCIPSTTEEEIERLLGPAHGGPVLKKNGGTVEVYSNAYGACDGSDAVLLATEHDEFRYTDSAKLSQQPVASAAPYTTAPRALNDPRPFDRPEPTETDLLALHKYLSSLPESTDASNPLGRFNDCPPCAEGCPECALERTVGATTSTYGGGGEHRVKEYLDWAKISYRMRNPKWVFDGRGLLDIRGMEKLGFRVETTGRQAGF
jgi:UDPglucose 6-dehydrogenase